MANLADQTVTRIDPASRKAVKTIPIGSAPVGLAVTRKAVWVTSGTGEVSTIDPTYDTLAHKLSPAALGTPAGTAYAPSTTVQPTLSAFKWIWVVDPAGYVSRIDPVSGRVRGSVTVGNDPSAIAAGAGYVWVANGSDGTLTQIDPSTLGTTTIPVGHGPDAIAVNAAGVWVANAGDDRVVRVETGAPNAVVASTEVGSAPAALLATPTSIWVANSGDGTVMRLDPRSGKKLGTEHVGGTPDALAFADGWVWVAVAPAPPSSPGNGGVAYLTAHNDPGPVDPAVDMNYQIMYATCANLVSYPDKPAPAGSHIVPEVAEAVPTPTAGGTTYTFTIRPGFRFSPPRNAPVTAATFKSTIERVVTVALHAHSPNAQLFSDIVGYRQYVKGKASGISGIVARRRTLTIRLTHPDGGFLGNLAVGAACAVPPGTPDQPLNDIPSAGPYYIKSYTPRRSLILRRNPNYRGDRPHHFDEFVYTIGVDPSRAVTEVEAGKADYASDGIPSSDAATLNAKYGPGSRAAKAGLQQYFNSEANSMRYLQMNASRPLFASARLRRAVNYAIDREALVAQERKFPYSVYGGGGRPTGDYIPPASLAARNFHLYPRRPDLREAKRLAGHVHATAILYSTNTPPWPQDAAIISRDLRPLGIDVEVKSFPLGELVQRVSNRGAPFDLVVAGWAYGPTDPDAWLSIFDGTTIAAINNGDLSYFDDPAFDRERHADARLSGPRRYLAFTRLAYRLERDEAPVAAIAIGTSQDFFSKRIGCQLYQPVYGIDLGALCLRRPKA